MATAQVVSAPAGGFTTAKHDLRKRARHRVVAEGLKPLQKSDLSHNERAKTNRKKRESQVSFAFSGKKSALQPCRATLFSSAR